MKQSCINPRLIAVFALLLTSFTVSAQDDGEYLPIRVMISSSFGFNTSLSSIQGGHITDDLISYERNSVYLQFISGTYFFNSNWGAGLSMIHNVAGQSNTWNARFDRSIEAAYGSQYYIDNISYEEYSSSARSLGLRFVMGPAYKIESGKVVFIGRLYGGLTLYSTESRQYILKEKNSNEILNKRYGSNVVGRISWVINPSVSVGYRIFRRIMLSADIGYTGYSLSPSFKETTVRESTGEITTQFYSYNSFVQEINLGVGVSVILWQK